MSSTTVLSRWRRTIRGVVRHDPELRVVARRHPRQKHYNIQRALFSMLMFGFGLLSAEQAIFTTLALLLPLASLLRRAEVMNGLLMDPALGYRLTPITALDLAQILIRPLAIRRWWTVADLLLFGIGALAMARETHMSVWLTLPLFAAAGAMTVDGLARLAARTTRVPWAGLGTAVIVIGWGGTLLASKLHKMDSLAPLLSLVAVASPVGLLHAAWDGLRTGGMLGWAVMPLAILFGSGLARTETRRRVATYILPDPWEVGNASTTAMDADVDVAIPEVDAVANQSVDADRISRLWGLIASGVPGRCLLVHGFIGRCAYALLDHRQRILVETLPPTDWRWSSGWWFSATCVLLAAVPSMFGRTWIPWTTVLLIVAICGSIPVLGGMWTGFPLGLLPVSVRDWYVIRLTINWVRILFAAPLFIAALMWTVPDCTPSRDSVILGIKWWWLMVCWMPVASVFSLSSACSESHRNIVVRWRSLVTFPVVILAGILAFVGAAALVQNESTLLALGAAVGLLVLALAMAWWYLTSWCRGSWDLDG